MSKYRKTLLAVGALFLSICGCTPSGSHDSEFRKTLQDFYNQYLASVQSEDEEKIRNAMSSYGFAILKNICFHGPLNLVLFVVASIPSNGKGITSTLDPWFMVLFQVFSDSWPDPTTHVF